MAKKILFARAKIEDQEDIICCDDIDNADYNSKYKFHLSCVNGCNARIKFTQKKNNLKFFSTWNGEGKLHRQDCPYHVEYKGVIGREKLNAFHKSIEIDDESILRRLQRKYYELHKTYNEADIPTAENGSLDVSNAGEDYVEVSVISNSGEKSNNNSYIRHKDANYLTTDDLGSIIGVYGKIKNAWIDNNKDGTRYAYINFDTKQTTVSILFSEAFYRHELANGVAEFERFIEKVKELIDSEKVVDAVVYGEITPKKKREKGVNVSVITPNRILLNSLSYKDILNKRPAVYL